MSSPAVVPPGKTAPRLAQDILEYDPSHAPLNVFTDRPEPSSAHFPPPPPRRQDYILSHGISSLPPRSLWQGSTEMGQYYLTAISAKTSWQIRLWTSYDVQQTSEICPTQQFPLHHFVKVNSITRQLDPLGIFHRTQHLVQFRCTSPLCPETLVVRFRSPILNEKVQERLFNNENLRARYDAAREEDPGRQDLKLSDPATVTSTLASYLRDAIQTPDGQKRPIPKRNKKFMTCFGEDCANILIALGFNRSDDDMFWYLPRVNPEDRTSLNNEDRDFVEELRAELDVLLNTLSGSVPSARFEPVDEEMKRFLGASTYTKWVQPFRSEADKIANQNDFAMLGAVDDLSDDLIMFAYNRQVHADQLESPLYFDCLKKIANSRNSTDLTMKATIIESEGQPGVEELEKAYRDVLGDPTAVLSRSNYLSDDIVLGKFRAALPDSGPAGRTTLKDGLRRIGRARNSQKLTDAAKDVIEDYEQALEWLGGFNETPDDFIQSMFTQKTAENPSDFDTARAAVSVIAEHRNSPALRAFLETGQTTQSSGMTVEDAYRILQINDRTAVPDPYMLDLTIDEFISQNAAREKEFREAGEVIKREALGQAPSVEQTNLAPEKVPVGLGNLGNTCYLNSLLQFYFTVKPLRELVLNFERHEVREADLQNRKLDKKINSLETVDRAQNLAQQLQELFRQMINSSTRTVNYEAKLARVAVVKPSDDVDESANISDEGAKKKDEFEKPAPVSHTQEMEAEMKDDASDDTLVVTPESGDEVNGDKVVSQNDSQSHGDVQLSTTSQAHEGNAGDNAQLLTTTDAMDIDKKAEENVTNEDLEHSQPPPQPPPVPPRPTSAMQKSEDLRLAEESVRQQDVNEVMSNVLDLLELAFTTSPDLNEEDRRLVERIFSGIEREQIESNTIKEEMFKCIYVPLLRKDPISFYEALDAYFDPSQESDVKAKFTTIKRNPKILQLVFRRNGFRREDNRQFKVNHYLEFDDKIYLDRYMDHEGNAGENLMSKRKESWDIKAEMETLDAREKELKAHEVDTELPQALETTSKYFSQLQSDATMIDDEDPLAVPEDLPLSLEQRKQHIELDLNEISSRRSKLQSKLNTIFTGFDSVEYYLHTVFMHRGGPASGHYIAYIKDFQHDVWRKYDDDRVTEVDNPQQDIFGRDSSPNPWTPYCLVYVQDPNQLTLTEALKREPEVQDQEMADVQTLNGVPVDSDDGSTATANATAAKAAKMVEAVNGMPDDSSAALSDFLSNL